MAREHIQLSKDLWLLPQSGAVIDFAARDSAFSEPSFEATSGEFKFAKWGKNNILPQEMLDLATSNHIKPKLIATEQEYLYGAGLKIFKRTITGGKERIEPAYNYDIEAFLDSFDVDAYIDRACNNLVMTQNVFTQVVFNALGEVVSLSCQDATDVRAGLIAPGFNRISEYGICPDWSQTVNPDKNPLQVLPALNEGLLQATAILHARAEQMGQKYYAYAGWWGTEAWTRVSNRIPVWHDTGIKNGYNIKYLIKVPQSYYEKYGNDEKAIQAKRQELRNDFDAMFTGEEGSDKSVWTTYGVDGAGKQMPGIIIETIGRTDSDKAYIELDKEANLNQALGHGVLPALAGIDTGGKFGGSGSEMRIASQLHTALKTPKPRKMLLKPFDLAARRNYWPREYFIGFADIELTTLDQNPNGTQRVVTNGQDAV